MASPLVIVKAACDACGWAAGCWEEGHPPPGTRRACPSCGGARSARVLSPEDQVAPSTAMTLAGGYNEARARSLERRAHEHTLKHSLPEYFGKMGVDVPQRLRKLTEEKIAKAKG